MTDLAEDKRWDLVLNRLDSLNNKIDSIQRQLPGDASLVTESQCESHRRSIKDDSQQKFRFVYGIIGVVITGLITVAAALVWVVK